MLLLMKYVSSLQILESAKLVGVVFTCMLSCTLVTQDLIMMIIIMFISCILANSLYYTNSLCINK